MSFFELLKELFSDSDATGNSNTPEGALIRVGGKHLTKTVTLNANNTTQSINLFQITGNVKILGIHGHITAKTTLTNLTNAYLAIWDGSVERAITKSQGATLSGYNVGAFFAKTQDASASMANANNSVGNYVETTTDKNALQQFFAIQKTGTNTYIRFTYTTTDAPINAEFEFHIEFSDGDTGTIIQA